MENQLKKESGRTSDEKDVTPTLIIDSIQKASPGLLMKMTYQEKQELESILIDKISNTLSSVVKIEHSEEMYQGPIPHPDIFKGIEEVIPGGAERVLKESEKQGDHRRSMEKKSIRGTLTSDILSKILAFIITSGGLLISYDLIKSGANVEGTLLAGGFLTTIVLAFLKYKQKKTSS